MKETITHKCRWLIQEWDDESAKDLTPEDLLKAYKEGKGRMIDNVTTNVGIVEMAKRNTGQSSNSNNKMLLGSANTPTPLASQTALSAQTGSVNLTSRTVEGTTERYLATATTASVSNNNLGEMGLASNTILISRVVVNPRILFLSGKTYTLMALMAHKAI